MANLGGSVIDFSGSYATRAGGAVIASAARSADRSATLLEAAFADTGARPAASRRRSPPPTVAHRLSAQIVDRRTKRGVPSLRVEAWDANTTADLRHGNCASPTQPGMASDLVAIACTDATGHFTMSITTAQMQALFLDRRPVLRLRLFVGSGAATGALPEPAWKWHLGPSTERARIEVDASAQLSNLAPALCSVRGRVRSRTGAPIVGATVDAVDVGLPEETSLGTGITDGDGYYAIPYAIPSGPMGCVAPELVVRVHQSGRRGAPRLVARSTIYCQAPPTLQVDLVVGGRYLGPSRYERVVASLGAAAEGLVDRSTAELDRLACRTGVASDELDRLVSARRVAARSDLGEEVLFGLMSAGLPRTYEELVKTHPRDVRAALLRARRGNDISPRYDAQVEATLARVRSTVLSSAAAALTPARATLAYALSSSTLAQAFIEAYLEHEEHDDRAFWAKLGRRPAFARSDLIARAKFALMVGALSNPERVFATSTDEPSFTGRGAHAGPPVDLFEAHHAPLVERLVTRWNEGTIKHIADLADLTRAEWETLLDGVGAPDEAPGLNATERAQNYAEGLRRTVQRLYPMRSVVADLTSPARTGNDAITTFFASPANRRLAFDGTRVAKHLASTTDALANVPDADRSALVSDLKTIERLYKLTTDADEIDKLRVNGVHSAAHAHALGPKQLAKMTGLSLAAATRITGKACVVAGGAMALQFRYASTFDLAKTPAGALSPPQGRAVSNHLPAMVLPDKATLNPDLAPPLPDWDHLFGNPDVCDCEHCHSVLSPAAYLVDLLCFLESIDAGSSHTARDVLLSDGSGPFPPRRPDIAKIDLSCKDTDTPLPYVDVVNEILAHVAVAVGNDETTFSFDDHITTKGEPRDLLAAPEILEPTTQTAANELLAGALYPLELPFNVWLTEARAFLPQLGIELYELMQALSPHGPPDPSLFPFNDKRYLPPPYVYDQLSWTERLGLFKESWDWFSEGFTHPNPVRWGFAPDDATWATKLLSAKTFLERSGLTYEELVSLLDSEFIRSAVAPGAPNPRLGPDAAVDACDLDKMSISGFAASPGMVWGAASKILFLRERLGCTIDEVDQYLSAGTATFDLALAQIAVIDHFHKDRGIALPVVLSWFGAMDTRRRGRPRQPSFFEQVFQSPTLGAPANSAFGLAAGPDYLTPGELADPSPLLKDHAAAIRGALGLGARDFALLTNSDVSTALVGVAAELPGGTTHLTLANLSQMHRIATFARALGLSIGDFLIVKRLFSDPSDAASVYRKLFAPENAYLFAQAVDRMKSGPLKPADLLFVFYGLATPACSIAPTSSRLDALVKKLSKELVATRQAADGASDPDGTGLLPLVQILFTDSGDVTNANRILLGEDPSDVPEDDAAFFAAKLAPLFAHSDAATRFVGGTALAPGRERWSYALGQLRAYVDSDRLIIQEVASDLKIAPEVAAVLLAIVKGAGGDPFVKSLRLDQYDSSDPDAIPPTLIAPDFGDYTRLHRAAAPVRALGMSAAEVVRFFVHGDGLAAGLRMLDLNEVLDASTSATVKPAEWFRRWLLLTDLWKLRGELVGGPGTLLALLPLGPDEASYDFIARTTAATGWSADDVVALTARMLPSAFQTVSADPPPALPDVVLALSRLHYAIRALRPLRVSAKTVIDTWFLLGTASASTLSAASPSTSVVETVRAHYADDQWPDVARPLRDRVRRAHRTALVDYLLGSGYVVSADDLYAWLLVDVEMEPVMLTSRIKQAIGSVQTFVQRALMNMEPHVTLDADQAKRWAWMKNYRVWEADRKVFLYPENWIEPALRDDKTTFFKQLESDLRRQDLTDENVEQAYVRYLEKLADVSSLEIAAMHHEAPRSDAGCDAVDVLHLVGRTVSQPKRYFYCAGQRPADSTRPRRWSPWEPIDLEIETEHLLLSMYHRRLHLFWTSVEEKPDSKQNTPKNEKNGDQASDGDEGTYTHLEIRLRWSERAQDRWTAPRSSTESLSTEFYYRNTVTASPLRTNRRDFNLAPGDVTLGVAVRDDGQLIVTCFLRLLRIARHAALTGFEYDSFSKAFGCFRIDPCTLTMTTAVAVPYTIVAWSELGSKLNEDTSAAKKELEDAKAFKGLMESFLDDVDFPKEAKKAILEDCQRNIDARNDVVTELENAPSPIILDVDATPDVTVTGLRVLDWTWNWRGQHLRPSSTVLHPQTLIIQDGKTSPALLKAWVTSEATVLRELALTLPQGDFQTEVGYPSPEKGPLVLMSVDGPLQGSTFLFEQKGAAAAKGKAAPYRAVNLFHHGICAFLTNVRQDGIDALLGNRALQVSTYDPIKKAHAKGQDLVERDTALVDFTDGSMFSVFNWELFFHAPLLIATRLSANRRYEAAQAWFHRIFDPTQGQGKPGTKWAKPPYSFWKVRPFFENKDLGSIQEELAQLDSDATNESKALNGLDDALGTSTSVQKLLDQIEAWRANPFKPHAIARLRPVAYQKAVVVKYIENLIAWGDDLFRRDTIETITEATQLYILGRQLLGARPRTLAAPPPPTVTMAGELRQSDAFSDAVVETESLMPSPSGGGCCGEPLPTFFTDYFCVVGNDKTTELWDTIADRLFKIRNSMDIEGVVRELALFEPPIDPALLVLAAAAGVDLQSVLADASAGTLPYRFQVVHGRAMELASGVSALGQALLQALEKRDGETITRLRQTQEIEVLRATREAKALEVKEASEAVKVAEAGQATIQKRLSHYASLLSTGVSDEEKASITHTVVATIHNAAGASLLALASAVLPVPQIKVGVAGLGPFSSTEVASGYKLAAILNASAAIANIVGTVERARAEAASTAASHQRRSEDWTFQIQLANAELKQSAKQVAAAKIRQAIAESSLATLDLQRDNARAVDDFLRDKLTNEDLYDWMSDKLMDLYYAAYKLAYDMAKRAEKAFQTELSIDGAPKYITFGYWDSAKRGLLSGEQLLQGLRALEVAYHEQNKRELEITKHVSLATSFPVELLALRELGECNVAIPEKLFERDFPSHYLRRLRHVSLSAHGVAGPYTSVNCTLRLTASTVRRKPTAHSVAPEPVTAETRAIVTSSGQADGGLFETNLRDERYLPFEGAGAISTWSLSLPPKTNEFDLRTLSDAVLHLQYTARDGGAVFGDSVAAETAFTTRTGLCRLIDVRAELAEVWASFQTLATADVPLRYADFRYLTGEKDITVTKIAIYVRRIVTDDVDADADVSVTFLPHADPSAPPEIAATTPSPWPSDPDAATGLHLATWPTSDPGETKAVKKSGTSDIEALRIAIDTVEHAANVQDLYIVVTYDQAIE